MGYPKTLPLSMNTAETPWEVGQSINGKPLWVQHLMFAEYSIGMHTHSFYEVNFIVSGQGAHYFENHVFEVHAGDIFVIPPGFRHGYWNEKHLAVHHILIHRDFFEKYHDELNNLPGFFSLFSVFATIQQCTGEPCWLQLPPYEFQELYDVVDRATMLFMKKNLTPHDVVSLHANVLYIIARLTALFAEQTPAENITLAAHPYLPEYLQCVEEIHLHYDKKMNIDELANHINVSRSTFFDIFRRYSGLSPAQYIMEFRIQKAKELLLRTDYDITRIAMMVGFFDASHFIRAFKKNTSQTPLQFRSKVTAPPLPHEC